MNIKSKKIACKVFIILPLILFSLFANANLDDSGKYRVFLNEFNSHPLNDFVKQMNEKVASQDLPLFMEMLKDLKVSSSFFKEQSLGDVILLPVIGRDFRDSNIALVIHGIEYLKPVIKNKYPISSYTKNPIPALSGGEFYYGEVNRIKPDREIDVLLVREGVSPLQAKLKSMIYHDGNCSFTKNLVVLNKSVEDIKESESALLIFGKALDSKIRVNKIGNKIENAVFWVADFNGDNVYDFIWGFDLDNGYNSYFKKFYSAYNLDGKWVPWRILNAKHWDSGC